MSLFETSCLWCGARYWAGVVGDQWVGDIHVCGLVKRVCQAPDCYADGRFVVSDSTGEPAVKRYVCQDHVGDSVVLAARTDYRGV